MSYDERTVVSQVERLTIRELRSWVREGWVRPAHGERGPFFDDLDIARVRLLCDLRKDMAISWDTIPVILSLIDRLHRSRREFQMLQQAIDEQPEDLRREVLKRYEKIRKP
ncbi:chaperone modulator CbpM [Histidinibacterium aquaticum]|uniref:MerR family transcriptional regulator n=1 Tax=Histidinibacterium aquaticum TaxID=2613962 RepID=A0A5J5GHW4_9RHOB|nr:chaperone modulator CbpM [Histidinibacterium aquaticum]KAA9007781.1 MerR family transcriptional regulator [Histidinibacterium aquaticum]